MKSKKVNTLTSPLTLSAIGDIKEAVPALDKEPQGLEGFAYRPNGFCTAIANHPCQNSSLLVIYCASYPELVAFVADIGL